MPIHVFYNLGVFASWCRKRSPELILLLVVGAVTLPFLNQAYHIDDRIYLSTSEQILKQPWFPYDYSLVFEGILVQDMASHSHLPFTSYYLALVRWLTGTASEWPYHLAFLIFPLLAAFSFYDIARRYLQESLVATILFLVSPAFLVLSHTLMPDVPLLAFWLLAISRMLRITSGEDAGSNRFVLVLAVLAAAFMSLLTTGLLLLILSHLFFRKWKNLPIHGSFFWLVLIAVPILLWVLWYTRAYLHYDRMVLATVFLYIKNERAAFDVGELGLKALSFVLNVGGLVLFPFAVWCGFFGRLKTSISALTFVVGLVVMNFLGEGWEGLYIFLFALMLSSGFLVVSKFVELLGDSRPEKRLLFLWFFGILATCLVLYFNGSARYVLLAVPPAILVWVQSLEHGIRNDYLRRNILWVAVVLTALYSGAISYADYRFARVYRNSAAELYEQYKTKENRVWFAGEWGFRYYLEREGAELLQRASVAPEPGDIIIKPYVALPWVTLYDGDDWTVLLEQREVEEPFPVRILDFSTQAGFYSTGWGLLPVSLSRGQRWEWFNVFRVERKYAGPVPEQPEWW